MQSILVSRLTDLLGEVQTSLLDLPAQYDELGAGLRAKCDEAFERLGLLLKSVYLTLISIPPEVEQAIDERASMGAIGDMQAYMQFRAARALGDAALAGGGEGGSLAGMGVGLGAGVGLGTAMASAIGQAVAPQTGAPVAPTGQGAGLVDGFASLKNLVAQQLTLSAEDKEAATGALDSLLLQLTSSTATMADVKEARETLTSRFSWLAGPVDTLLNTPAGLQMLGQIAARSM
jgi:membrane protease subunit (stomatin/prohibitin family)